jgi:hypothetical protein
MIPFRRDRSSPFRRIVATAIAVAALATLALVLVALILPGRAALALRWYLVAIAAIAVVAAIRSLVARYPVLWRPNADSARMSLEVTSGPPARLRTINGLVTRSQWDGVGFQLELRPILRAIAAQRLATFRTIDLDGEPAAARSALGEEAWALLSPVDVDRAKGEYGIEQGGLRAAVETLEELNGIADD